MSASYRTRKHTEQLNDDTTRTHTHTHPFNGPLSGITRLRKGKELNRSIGSKSLHPFVQRLLVPSVRKQVAKPQVLTRSQQNCSKQEERRYWTECTEYVWRSGKLVSGQRNGRSLRSSHFSRKAILNSVQITKQLLLSPMQARSFFGSYWRGSE